MASYKNLDVKDKYVVGGTLGIALMSTPKAYGKLWGHQGAAYKTIKGPSYGTKTYNFFKGNYKPWRIKPIIGQIPKHGTATFISHPGGALETRIPTGVSQTISGRQTFKHTTKSVLSRIGKGIGQSITPRNVARIGKLTPALILADATYSYAKKERAENPQFYHHSSIEDRRQDFVSKTYGVNSDVNVPGIGYLHPKRK